MSLNFIKLNAIDSTNDYLKALRKQTQLDDGTVVVAHRQEKGRGQRLSSWQSQEGKSLTFSMFKRYKEVAVLNKSILTFLVSIAISEALKKLSIPSVTIKWPNDILSYNKKVCGLLIENQVEGKFISASIIGVGLNVNETNFNNLPKAGSLKLVTGNHFELENVLTLVCNEIFEKLLLAETVTSQEVKQAYESLLFKKDVVSTFRRLNDGTTFNGIIRGVSADAELLVEVSDETILSFQLKEVELLY